MLLRLSFWVTLTLATLVYWRLPSRVRSGFLGVVSFLFLFYMAGGDGDAVGVIGALTPDRLALLMLLVWTLLSFRFARTSVKDDPWSRVRKNALILGLLGYLGYFKYFPEIFSALFSHDMGALFHPVGISYYTFKLVHYAIDGVTSFTTLPLRVWSLLGLAISLLALVYSAIVLTNTIIFGADIPGFPTLIISVMFFSGAQLISLGILGEYLGRVYEEVKARPLYIVADRIGLDTDDDTSLPGGSEPPCARKRGPGPTITEALPRRRRPPARRVSS